MRSGIAGRAPVPLRQLWITGLWMVWITSTLIHRFAVRCCEACDVSSAQRLCLIFSATASADTSQRFRGGVLCGGTGSVRRRQLYRPYGNISDTSERAGSVRRVVPCCDIRDGFSRDAAAAVLSCRCVRRYGLIAGAGRDSSAVQGAKRLERARTLDLRPR